MTLAEHLESIKMMSRENLLKLKEGDSLIFIKEKSGIEIMIDTIKNCHVELSGKMWVGIYICQN